MWHVALSSLRTRSLCERAMHCAALPPPRGAAVGDVLTRHDALVHDFHGDLQRSCTWLDTLAASGQAPVIVALLETPASPVLHALLQPQRRFRCADILLANECTPLSLASPLLEASSQIGEQEVTAVLRAVWSDDAVLLSMARTALQLANRHARQTPEDGTLPALPQLTANWPAEAQLLKATRVGRGRFVRHARKAGFVPALRFLQVCRVLAVAHALQAGRRTIEGAAQQFGYSSAATLRRHFRTLAGMPPQEGRHLSLTELAEIMRRRSGQGRDGLLSANLHGDRPG